MARKSRNTRNNRNNRTARRIGLNSSVTNRRNSKNYANNTKKTLYINSLPKGRLQRLKYRLEPKHLYEYWFSKEGGIMALRIIGISIVAIFILIVVMFAFFRKDLPKINDISGSNLGGSVSYYDRTGKTLLFQDNNGIRRLPVNLDQISPYMKNATIAIEDKNFYHEGAFDIKSLIRAGSHDLIGLGGGLQGGSTITQQLVKLNQNWTNDRTITRKFKELILAVEVERSYSKDQILNGYLNIAPYGGVDYGVQAASQDYFHKSAADLTLAEASFLAAIPQAPGVYSPYTSTVWNKLSDDSFNKQGVINRQHYILTLMVQQKYITQAQADAAKATDVLAEIPKPLNSNTYSAIQAPYFVMTAKQQLQTQLGAQLATTGGIKVTTTLDLKLQQFAEKDVAANSQNVKNYNGNVQAMVGEDVKTGQMLMLVGGENWFDSTIGQVNYANVNILPGSSVKPFVYGSLIENNTNVGAGSMIYDTEQEIKAGGQIYYYCPNGHIGNNVDSSGASFDASSCLHDYDHYSPGPVSLRYALAGSRNIPAIKAVLSVVPNDTSNGHLKSINKYTSTYQALTGSSNSLNCYKPGVQPLYATSADTTQCYPASAIGDGVYTHLNQLVNADASLARLGQTIPTTYILSVQNTSGKSLYQWTQPKPKQVVRADTAYIINNILSDPKATYLGTSFSSHVDINGNNNYMSNDFKFQNWNGWNTAIKTGTQNSNQDGLMTAWNTQFAVVSYVANSSGNSLRSGGMEHMTGPLSIVWMKQALNSLNTKPVNWTEPTDIKHVNAFLQTSKVGTGSSEILPGPVSEIFPSWFGVKGVKSGATIDQVSGLLATSCTPNSAKKTNASLASTFNIDIFMQNGQPNYVSNMQVLEGGPVSGVTGTTSTSDNIHKCTDTSPSLTISVSDSSGAGANTCSPSCDISIVATAGTYPLSGGNYTAAPAGQINIKVNGNVVNTITIPTDTDSQQSYNATYRYTSSSASNSTIQAVLNDSVLYETTASQSVSLTTGLTGFRATKNSTSNYTFNWSGGVSPFNISINGTNLIGNCANVSLNTCTSDVPKDSKNAVIIDSSNITQTTSL